MSWDIFVQDIPKEIKTIEDFQKYEDYKPNCIGKKSDIIKKIQEVVPEADFSDTAWGKIEGSDYSIEVNMGDDDDCYGFALHVRGSDTAAFIVSEIISHLGLRAFDPGSDDGMFKIGQDSLTSFRKWKKYRDRVLSKNKKQQGKN